LLLLDLNVSHNAIPENVSGGVKIADIETQSSLNVTIIDILLVINEKAAQGLLYDAERKSGAWNLSAVGGSSEPPLALKLHFVPQERMTYIAAQDTCPQ
jgi:hypothetical protein